MFIIGGKGLCIYIYIHTHITCVYIYTHTHIGSSGFLAKLLGAISCPFLGSDASQAHVDPQDRHVQNRAEPPAILLEGAQGI